MFAWRTPNCALPDCDKRLAILVNLSPKKWKTLKPTIMAFWTKTPQGWTQNRLSFERERVAKMVAQKSAAGKESARSKARKKNKLASTAVPTEDATKVEHQGNNQTQTQTQTQTQKDDNEFTNSSSSAAATAELTNDEHIRVLRAAGYDEMVYAPPDWKNGQEAIAQWKKDGLSIEQIIEAAKTHTKHIDKLTFSPAGLNQAMERARVSPAPRKVTTGKERLGALAEMINGNGFCSPQSISAQKARTLLSMGLVTAERLAQRNIDV